jgi:pyruvate dehydrogenase E2 component (dihydrolipoamide acetyltransferase)
MANIVMPDLSTLDYQMETATLVQWYKQAGERVEKGEPLFEVMTEKVTITIESTASGTVQQILVPEGEEAEPGKVLATLE